MKHILAFILALLMILSLVSCSNEANTTGSATNEETKKTTDKKNEKIDKKEEKEEIVYMKVEDPLTWDDINAIPIAKEGMTSDELRQICIDYFNLAMSFRYIPDKSFGYQVTLFKWDRTVEEGKIYGGLPYVTHGTGTLYRLMDFYDPETGILKASTFSNDMKLFGNTCSRGASLAWTRVVNSVTQIQWTWGMTQANGYIKVGPYQYDLTLTEIGKNEGDYSTHDVCNENGEQIMFQSYAAVHKADGLTYDGHARMITQEPYVVENEDGTINGEESYLVCSDQICYNTTDKYKRTQSDGSVYYIAGGQNIKYSFNELFKDGYLPFTFAEFLGTDPVEDGKVLLDYTGNTITPRQVCTSTVTSNYIMCDVYFIVTDANGTEKLNFAKRILDLTTMKLLLEFSPSYFEPYADGKHTLEIKVQLGNGERLTAYNGILVKE